MIGTERRKQSGAVSDSRNTPYASQWEAGALDMRASWLGARGLPSQIDRTRRSANTVLRVLRLSERVPHDHGALRQVSYVVGAPLLEESDEDSFPA